MALDDDTTAAPESPTTALASLFARLRTALLATVVWSLFAVQPALAQSSGTAFCGTEMAQTIKNIFTLIQYGGPLIGGVVALGAIAMIPTVRSVDRKQELKVLRNQGFLWGVIVAPLGTAIVQFILNSIVAGGASCGF